MSARMSLPALAIIGWTVAELFDSLSGRTRFSHFCAVFNNILQPIGSHLRNGWTTVGPLEPHFRDQGAKTSNRLVIQEQMKPLNHSIQDCKHFQNLLKNYREFATRTWPKVNRFLRFSSWAEAAVDIISIGNVETTEGYVVLNFETASIRRCRENQN